MVEKVDSQFVVKLQDKLKKNEPIKNLKVDVKLFLRFHPIISSPIYQSVFVTKDGAKEFAKYFANHKIISLTVVGEYNRRSRIWKENLSKIRKSGVIEMIKAFSDVNVENLVIVCIFNFFLTNIFTKKWPFNNNRQKLHTAILMTIYLPS